MNTGLLASVGASFAAWAAFIATWPRVAFAVVVVLVVLGAGVAAYGDFRRWRS